MDTFGFILVKEDSAYFVEKNKRNHKINQKSIFNNLLILVVNKKIHANENKMIINNNK